MKKDYISISDWSEDWLQETLEFCGKLKKETKQGQRHDYLKGMNIGMVFEKSSLRTKVSFEVGINQMGGHAVLLDSSGRLGEREPVADFARVVSGYLDGIVVRTFSEDNILMLSQLATIPVINALTDESHPCQALGDAFTLLEHFGKLKGLSLGYVGDANNVASSLMNVCKKTGMHFKLSCPEKYAFKDKEAKLLKEWGFEMSHEPSFAVRGSDAVYTDVWTSMGQEKEKEQRLKDFAGFGLNEDLMSHGKKETVVMHCLPAHRGEEISHGILEQHAKTIFTQAENRLHIQKALMARLMGRGKNRP